MKWPGRFFCSIVAPSRVHDIVKQTLIDWGKEYSGLEDDKPIYTTRRSRYVTLGNLTMMGGHSVRNHTRHPQDRRELLYLSQDELKCNLMSHWEPPNGPFVRILSTPMTNTCAIQHRSDRGQLSVSVRLIDVVDLQSA